MPTDSYANSSRDRFDAAIDERNRTALRAGQFRLEIDAEALVDRRRDLGRRHRTVLRRAADLVGRADHRARP